MSDIDFDELDKAVNSVMSVAPASTEVAPSEASLSVETPESAPPQEERPVVERVPTASLAKRRGRFMDVVHPSSDMKTSTSTAQPQSREGVAMAPLVQNNQPGEATELQAATVDSPVEQPEEVPLSNKESKLDSDNGVNDDTNDLLSSPFLPDAKVEKRPLGGQSNDKLADEMARLNDSELQSEAAIATVDTPVETTVAKSDEPTTSSDDKIEPTLLTEVENQPAPLPAELSSDLVAIESGDATSQSMPSDTETTETAPQTDNDGKVLDEKLLQKSPEEPAETKTKKAEAVAPISGSIAQQYKETPTTNQEAHASIYDAHTDIAPLEHLTKKKTSWLYVVLIVTALLIGGGGGAAVYFLNLI